MSRSEKKKHREQKRRKQVNKGLDELMALLVEIDPSIKSTDGDKSRQGQAKAPPDEKHGDHPLLNRVDLISRTVSVLDRLYRENKQQKLIIEQLSRVGGVIAAGGQSSSLAPQLGDTNQVRKRGLLAAMLDQVSDASALFRD